jgi:DNA polymerase III subunit beta
MVEITMKIRAGDLETALSAIIKTIDARNTVLILDHVLIEPIESGIATTAHGLDRCATAQCPAVEADIIFQATTVRGDQFHDLARALPRDAVVELAPDDGHLNVKCGRSRYRLPTLPAVDFPTRLSAGDAPVFTLGAGDVMRMFKWPGFAVSRDETRYYLEGIFLHQLRETLVAVATDGHRLARAVGAVPNGWPINGSDRPGAIVPRRFADQVVKLDGDVTIKLSADIIEAKAGRTIIVSKLIDATYPDYARLIPRPSNSGFECDRKELAAVAARLEAVAQKGKSKNEDASPAADFSWKDGAVHLTLTRQSEVAEDTIDARVNGSGRVAIKLEYLTELLAALPGERIRFEHAEASGPIAITIPDNADLLVLQMPTRW